MRSTTKLAVAAVAALWFNGASGAQETFRHVVIAPNELKWVDNPQWPGRRTAMLFGNQQAAGQYVVRVRFPPNTLNPPHTHPDDRLVTVLTGTVYLGHGDTADRTKTTRITAGTFFTEPGGNLHYEHFGPDEVIVQVVGTGPTGTDYKK
jgi:quercetin dioxygenase-like cupin family protein